MSACSIFTDPKTEGCGRFAGRAAGAASDSLVGNHSLTGQFGLLLTNGAPTTAAQKVRLFRAVTPDTGVFAMGAEPSPFTGVITAGTQTFTISSGTIHIAAKTITQLTRVTGLSGTLNVTGVDAGGAQISVIGQFEARCMANQEFGENDVGVEGKGVCGGGAVAVKSPRPKNGG
jgi:hypothetical protein